MHRSALRRSSIAWQAVWAVLCECSLPTVGKAGRQDRLMRPECDLLVDYVSFIFPWRLTGNKHN